MKLSGVFAIALCVLSAIQVLSFVVAISHNRTHGDAVYKAFVKYESDRTPEAEREFHQEMARLDDERRRVRLYGMTVFALNSMLIIGLTRKLHRLPRTGGTVSPERNP